MALTDGQKKGLKIALGVIVLGGISVFAYNKYSDSGSRKANEGEGAGLGDGGVAEPKVGQPKAGADKTPKPITVTKVFKKGADYWTLLSNKQEVKVLFTNDRKAYVNVPNVDNNGSSIVYINIVGFKKAGAN